MYQKHIKVLDEMIRLCGVEGATEEINVVDFIMPIVQKVMINEVTDVINGMYEDIRKELSNSNLLADYMHNPAVGTIERLIYKQSISCYYLCVKTEDYKVKGLYSNQTTILSLKEKIAAWRLELFKRYRAYYVNLEEQQSV